MNSLLKDRLGRGFAAGILGWLPTFVFSMAIDLGFHLLKLRFMDFAGILAFDHKPHGFWEALFSEAIVLAQMGALGMLFTLIIAIIARPHLLLKGGLYGGFTWFITYAMADLFKVTGIHGTVDFPTAFFNLIASVLWGTALGWALLWLNRKYDVQN